MALVGWILLSILGFVLFLFLLVLFFPIFYRIEGSKTDQTVSKQITVQNTIETEDHLLENSIAKIQIPLEVSAKVSWLFGLIRAMFSYPDPCKLIVKLGFFTILGRDKKKKSVHRKKERKKPDQNESDSQKTLQENAGQESLNPDDPDRKNDDQKIADQKHFAQEHFDQKNFDQEISNQENSDQKIPDQKDSGQENFEQESSSQEMTGQIETDQTGTDQIEKEQKKADKKKPDIKAIKEKITKEYAFYHGLWLEKDTKPFLKDALKRVFHILRNLMPRSIRGSILFGAASPDVTGYLYGGYCVLSTIFPKKLALSFTPDFEREVLEGQIVIKGHFTIFTLLIDGLRILFDRRLKRLRRKLKKHLQKT